MAKVRTEAELSDALKNKEETIEIEGDLANKTFKIRATGNVAWGVVIGAIAIAAYGAIVTVGTGGATAPATATAGFIAAPVAVSILGGATTYSAIAIAVAAGGVGVLTTLRGYKQVSRSPNRLVLKRR
jgi:hypothetical protein